MPTYHYIPILKSLRAELRAISLVEPTSRKDFTPLIEVLDFEPKPLTADQLRKRKTAAPTFKSKIVSDNKLLTKHIGRGNRAFFDFHYTDQSISYAKSTGSHILDTLLGQHSSGVVAMPVIRSDSSAACLADFARYVTHAGPEVCFRLTRADLGNRTLESTIKSLLAHVGSISGETHLVIDFGEINEGEAKWLASTAQSLIDGLSNPMEWKTLTVASGAFPASIYEYDLNTLTDITREDYELWRQVIVLNCKRNPDYGDYTVVSPNFRSTGRGYPFIHLRYAADEVWKLSKDDSTIASSFDYSIMVSTAERILHDPSYMGRMFSIGDRWIDDVVSLTESTGNAETWKCVGINHHLCKVLSQI